jgi:hypothetical protein
MAREGYAALGNKEDESYLVLVYFKLTSVTPTNLAVSVWGGAGNKNFFKKFL